MENPPILIEFTKKKWVNLQGLSLLEEYPRFCRGTTDDWHQFFLASGLGLSGDFPWLPSALQELDDPEEQAARSRRPRGFFVSEHVDFWKRLAQICLLKGV